MARMPNRRRDPFGWRSLCVAALVVAVPTVALSAGPVVALHRTVTAGDLGYPYPNAPDCNEQTGANCVSDKWGFVQGQCHSWVAYRLNELNAAELNGATFDDHYRQPAGQEWWNPVHWKTAAQAAGITVDDKPALGSVAWWSTNGGHVAYVEAVNADGSVKISEMNTDYHNGFDFATLVRGQRWPSGFIHIADRSSSAAAPDPPTNVHAVAGSASATITWSVPAANGSPITGYRVRTTSGTRSVLAAANATSVTMTRLQPGTSYTFTVRAINAIGRSARSAPSNAVVPTT